jgi:hypothetical protein
VALGLFRGGNAFLKAARSETRERYAATFGNSSADATCNPCKITQDEIKNLQRIGIYNSRTLFDELSRTYPIPKDPLTQGAMALPDGDRRKSNLT